MQYPKKSSPAAAAAAEKFDLFHKNSLILRPYEK
jgi:hypothetical protein